MPHYFYVHDSDFLIGQVLPALAECQRGRSFQPLQPLLPLFRISPGEDDLLRDAQSIPFDRRVFKAVVGQTLIFAAQSMPHLPLDVESLIALLAPDRLGQSTGDRRDLSPIEQVFLGSRDLLIGARPYRPFHVGWNTLDDVPRLANYLQSIDANSWTPETLRGNSSLPEGERVEELELIRDWWPDLVAMVSQTDVVIVCEHDYAGACATEKLA